MKLTLTGRRFAQSGAAPTSFDAAARSVTAVLSKGSAVTRSFGVEKLRISKGAVDLGRLASAGIPVLDSHTQRGISNALGRVVSVWIDGDALMGRIVFNETDEGEKAMQMVARGEISAVSIGYITSEWEVRDEKGRKLDPDTDRLPTDGSLTFTATRWELLEASLVSVPADAEATIRSFDNSGKSGASSASGARARMQARQRMLERQSNPISRTAASKPLPQPTRNNSVIGDQHVAPQIQEQTSMSRISIIRDEREGVTDAMSIALATRILASSGLRYEGPKDPIGKAHFAKYRDQARQYEGYGLIEMAAQCIGYRGGLVYSMSTVDKLRVLERAFNSTSDFPNIFQNALNKSLLARYQLVTPTYRELAVERPFKDFRPHPQVRGGDFPLLQPVQQNGELKVGGSTDGGENVSVTPYGIVFTISRQMLINDDLGAVDQILSSAGDTVLIFENDVFFTMFNSNPTLLTDSLAVFAPGHGNLAASGAAPSVTSVGEARQALRGMRSLSGNFLNVPPRIILTGPVQETLADQIVASITPTLTTSVNPFSGRLHSISDANITDTSWYILSDPARVPCFIYGFLNGSAGPRTTIHSPFGMQGVKVSLEHDFGVGAIDFRGAYRNPGA